MKPLTPLFMISGLFISSLMMGQTEELKQKLSAFAADHDASYEKKYLNIADREIGSIDNTSYSWKDEFMLKSKEKAMNNLGNNSYQKFYFFFYAYETVTDRKYALKDWMADFIEGKSIRAGRPVRKYDYATPTIILINDTEIMVCNYKCSDFSDDNFKYWRKTLLTYFGEDNTMVIEIGCNGPLEWTKNAPDPKNRREMP